MSTLKEKEKKKARGGGGGGGGGGAHELNTESNKIINTNHEIQLKLKIRINKTWKCITVIKSAVNIGSSKDTQLFTKASYALQKFVS